MVYILVILYLTASKLTVSCYSNVTVSTIIMDANSSCRLVTNIRAARVFEGKLYPCHSILLTPSFNRQESLVVKQSL
jgi:hypothetical protein